MTIHRMRTVQEALEEIHKADAGSAVTANCIRTLCKNGELRCIHTGKKILVDLDDLLNLMGEPDKQEESD